MTVEEYPDDWPVAACGAIDILEEERDRLRDALEAAAKSMDSAIRILNDTGLDYEERVLDARPYLHSRASVAHQQVGGQLPERCDKCGWGHNVGNPCPPTGQFPECGKIERLRTELADLKGDRLVRKVLGDPRIRPLAKTRGQERSESNDDRG